MTTWDITIRTSVVADTARGAIDRLVEKTTTDGIENVIGDAIVRVERKDTKNDCA